MTNTNELNKLMAEELARIADGFTDEEIINGCAFEATIEFNGKTYKTTTDYTDRELEAGASEEQIVELLDRLIAEAVEKIEEAELLEVSDEAEWKEHFNSLKSEETEETAETEESTLIRKIVVKVNDQWTQTTEIIRNNQKPNCFTRHTFWTFGLNTSRTNEVSIELDNSFLEEELKKIESNIRHYGNRVLENI